MLAERCIAIAVVLVLFVSVSSAGPLIDGNGDDSGWSATLGTNDTVTNVTVLDVDPGVSMTLEIEKDFVGMDAGQNHRRNCQKRPGPKRFHINRREQFFALCPP